MDVNLVIFRENGERRDFPVVAGITTVGRKDDCDIRIPVLEVSRHHAEFRQVPDGVQLRDLGSANGTFVNNQKIKQQKLKPGDHVVIGPVVFTVQIDGKPDNIRPVKTKLHTRRSTPVKPSAPGAVAVNDDEELDPISALEALASSADQTALDPFDEDEDEDNP